MTNKDLVISFYKALDNDEFETAEKILGPQHQMNSSMSPVPVNAEQHVGISKAFHEAFSNGKHEWEDILEIGNKVVLRGSWHGVHNGTFNGIPATGKTVRLTFITITEIENNGIKNQWLEMDSMSLMMQLGALPAPSKS